MAESTSKTDEDGTGNRKRVSNTNMYYAQYASGSESEPGYDSDSSRAAKALRLDPKNKKFYEMRDKIDFETKYHQNWIDSLKQDTGLKQKAEKYTGMLVRLAEDLVRFKCNLEIEGRSLKSYRVRIVLAYCKYNRRWAFDHIHSHIPDVVTFPEDISYFHKPISNRILRIVVGMRKKALDYLKKCHYFDIFMAKVENDYLDVKIVLDKAFTRMDIEIQDNAWPETLWRTDFRDTLTIRLGFDKDCNIVEATFKFQYQTHAQDPDESNRRRNVELVSEKLAGIGSMTLEEIFEKLMGKKLVGNRYKFHNLNDY